MNMSVTPPEPDTLLADILEYCSEHGMSKTAFGKAAVNDACLVGNMERGRDLRTSTVRRILDFMAQEVSP